MNWAIFLHFYQPTGQQKEVIENVVNTAYRPILVLIDKYPAARVSVNINACLSEQLHNFGFDDILRKIMPFYP
jgi:alpha-amylase/alpha-mannosidase (GH57 family)